MWCAKQKVLSFAIVSALLTSGFVIPGIAAPQIAAPELSQVLPSVPEGETLPPEVSEKLLQAIAEQQQVPLAALHVVESKSATWDGCLGIYEPDRACTMIAIPGYRVIVAGDKVAADQLNWVYHISSDGSRIAQNSTATSRLTPSFATADESPFGELDGNIVFRSIESGGLAGLVTERILTTDGTLYRQVHNPRERRAIEPVIEKQLSAQQVRRFQALLENQRFPNLNQLRYLTDAAFADYPTITVQGLGSSVEYIDLEIDRLPRALRRVIRAWDRLGK
jgi:hypothetical protein